MLHNRVGVSGGGMWGSTLSWLLARNGVDVYQWHYETEPIDEINKLHTHKKCTGEIKLPKNLIASGDLEETISEAKMVLLVIPSSVFREVAVKAGEYLNGEQVIIHGTKGIEGEGLYRMTEILAQETCCKKTGVLSGPNLAKEIQEQQPTATVVASRFEEVVKMSQELLSSPLFKVYGSNDPVGAEIGGALKNIVALAAGMARGLGFGDNSKAALMTRGIAEISRLGVALGANPLTFSGLSGIGDLIATCASPLSRNHHVGYRLGKGETLEGILSSMTEVAEGVKTTYSVHMLAERHGVEMPITDSIYSVLYRGMSISDTLRLLMSRPYRDEIDFGSSS